MKKRDITASEAPDTEQGLFEAIAAIRTAEEAGVFFRDLCSPAEIQAMADRWAVVEPIKRGEPYRSIFEKTGVSVTTIGRVARNISFGTGGYDLIFNRCVRKCCDKK